MPDKALKPTHIMDTFHAAFHALALLAGMRLDLFTPLKDGPMDAKTLAEVLGVAEDKLSPLLYSLVAANLLKLENGCFSNTEETAAFLVRGCPDYIGGLGGLYTMFLSAGLKTAESIQSGSPQARFDFRALPEEELLAYFKKQVHSSLNGGREIAAKFDFSPFENLLDAGGGTGGVAIALCSKYPHLKATVADLPAVARLTPHFIVDAEMSGRIGVSSVDLCSAPPAGCYDVAVLRALLQTLSKEEGGAALKNIGRAMSPGARVFIFGSILENSRLAPTVSVNNNLAFLNFYDNGRSYTEDEHKEMLTAAGFTDIRVSHEVLADGMGLIQATKM